MAAKPTPAQMKKIRSKAKPAAKKKAKKSPTKAKTVTHMPGGRPVKRRKKSATYTQ